MIKRGKGIIVDERGDSLDLRVLFPVLKGGLEKVNSSVKSVETVVWLLALAVRPAGFGNKDRIGVLDADGFKEG